MDKEETADWERALRRTREHRKRDPGPERIGESLPDTLDRIGKKYAKAGRGTGEQKGGNRWEPPKGGYTRVPNRFIEAAYRQGLGHNQSSVLWYLVRKTWGWQKRSEFIRVTDMANELKIPKSRVSEALTSLRKRGIVTVNRNKTYAIEMNTSSWKDLRRQP